ncbi:uncharacterized protein BXZ73DRAFT_102897 [Epithele typhae]|uniref:uncharacterized protein n=1 Tax=Epithele typhae TaxID=378194 RepID=UPI0020076840|nr:uncharacterized protein BXZ73DRAFT_102897 [Epithele typhae]KAH9926642.1 hypothetical protein BXZ73DRAFT_102897 [Epithele typhae]
MADQSSTFTWLSVHSIDSCTQETIGWNYTGPDRVIDIHLSAANASADAPTDQGTTIATGVDALQGRWTWASANVSEGRYFFFIDEDFYTRSPFFNVAAGILSSCILTSAPASSTIAPVSASKPSSILLPDVSAADPSNMPLPDVSVSSPSSEPRPVTGSAASSSSSRRIGAIAGGAVSAGLVFALCLLLLVRVANRRRRRAELRAWRVLDDGKQRARGHAKRSSIAKPPLPAWDASAPRMAQMPAEPPSAYGWAPTGVRSPFADAPPSPVDGGASRV